MRTPALAFLLVLAWDAATCTAQSSVRDALNWAHSVLLESDTSRFEERLFWADSILAREPVEAALRLEGHLYLFPSFHQAEGGDAPNLNALRLMWFAAAFEVQNRQRTSNSPLQKLPFAPPLDPNSAERFIPRNPWLVGVASVLVLAAAIAWGRERSKRPRKGGEELSEDLLEVLHLIGSHLTPAACRIDLISLAFDHGRHPVQLAAADHQNFRELSPSELMLAAYLHDGIEMEAIALAMEKSRGTLYNMRSQLRKKLAISENADLTTELRLRSSP